MIRKHFTAITISFPVEFLDDILSLVFYRKFSICFLCWCPSLLSLIFYFCCVDWIYKLNINNIWHCAKREVLRNYQWFIYVLHAVCEVSLGLEGFSRGISFVSSMTLVLSVVRPYLRWCGWTVYILNAIWRMINVYSIRLTIVVS